jgi:NLI interacting factor-like phosphatase
MYTYIGIREAFTSQSKSRAFKVRSSAVAFVQFVCNYFEVALWSCSKKQNLDEDIEILFPGSNENMFLFRWHQDNSTNLWPRSSIVSKSKPLFLKELTKVSGLY